MCHDADLSQCGGSPTFPSVGRRSSLGSWLVQQQRERERQARAQQRAVAAAVRTSEQARRAYERAQAWEQKEQKRLYVEARQAEVDAMNEQIAGEIESLESLLRETLDVDDYLDFETLKRLPELPKFDPAALATPEAEVIPFTPPPQGGTARFLPGAKAKHEQEVAVAREFHERKVAARAERERSREEALREAREAHEAEVAKIEERTDADHREVDAFHARFDAGEPEAIVEYFSLVLDASSYPEDFPKKHRMAFVPESKQLVVEYELPTLDESVPTDKQYRHVRARDAIEHTTRPASQLKALYSSVVAQVTIRTLHELFEADRQQKLETIVFNAYVNTVDPATGKPVSPHLVTVRTSRDLFLSLDLRNVEPLACLKGLNASVSKSPSELVPVRPILEFDMVDSRFIQESDVLATLDERPNLMELTPGEFESLITNLFEKMGLDTKQT
jgi:restriction system protein